MSVKTSDKIFSNKTVLVDSFELMVRSNNISSAQTIVMVHGIGVSEKYFRPLAEVLSVNYNCILLNLPGYGETKRPDKVLKLEEQAGLLAKLFEQESIVSPIVIGHSMGCQIVSRLAASHSYDIKKLILLSPTVNARERSSMLQSFRLLQDSFKEPLKMTLMIIQDYFKFGMLRYLVTQRYMIKDDIEASLALCTVPVLLVRGEIDPIVRRDWAVSLHDLVKGSELREIKNAPHNFHYTNPSQTGDVCTNFIKK
jgi:pimeloyl-ACP methyl ester carboxylesterase